MKVPRKDTKRYSREEISRKFTPELKKDIIKKTLVGEKEKKLH